jgi:Peptidase A4 family
MRPRSLPRQLSRDESLKRLRVFRSPPPKFNPLKASRRELALYGLPHPPDPGTHPRQAKLWRMQMSGRPEWVKPEPVIGGKEFVPYGGFRGKPGDGGFPPASHPLLDPADKRFFSRPGEINEAPIWLRNYSPLTANIWSGAMAPQPPGEPYNNVYASFEVPAVSPPASAWNGKSYNDGNYQCLTWVGIDGWNGPDVMQAGAFSQVTVSKGSLSYTYYAFYEFWPALWLSVPNFPVSAGDILAVNVCAPFTTTHAVTTIKNQSTNQVTTIGFNAPGTTKLSGAMAEWIVENPGVQPNPNNPDPKAFANYGNVIFHDCIAGSRTQERDLLSASPINMVKADGTVMSTGWIDTRSQLTCSYGTS